MVYRVILAKEIEPLCRKVSEFLNAGWICVGGIVADTEFYLQSIMIDELPEGEELSFECIEAGPMKWE